MMNSRSASTIKEDSLEVRRRWTQVGGVLWSLAPIEFITGMVVTQLGWTTPYSVLENSISDLGAVGCENWTSGRTRYVCSPRHDVFNISIIILGVMFVSATVLVARAFPPGRRFRAGLALFAVGGAGSIGVGLFPQDVNLSMHSISAVLALVGGNIAILTLGYAMVGRPGFRGYEVLSITCGAVGLAAFAWFLSGLWGPLGPGGTERIVEGSRLLWALLLGLHLIPVHPATISLT